MAIEQWGFFNVPHLLWHGPTLFNGHLRGPVTITPIAEHVTIYRNVNKKSQAYISLEIVTPYTCEWNILEREKTAVNQSINQSIHQSLKPGIQYFNLLCHNQMFYGWNVADMAINTILSINQMLFLIC